MASGKPCPSTSPVHDGGGRGRRMPSGSRRGRRKVPGGGRRTRR